MYSWWNTALAYPKRNIIVAARIEFELQQQTASSQINNPAG